MKRRIVHDNDALFGQVFQQCFFKPALESNFIHRPSILNKEQSISLRIRTCLKSHKKDCYENQYHRLQAVLTFHIIDFPVFKQNKA